MIRLLSTLFGAGAEYPWEFRDGSLDYKEDRTQWAPQGEPIEIAYELELRKDDDPALISFIEKMASVTSPSAVVRLQLCYHASDIDDLKVSARFGDSVVEDKAAKEVNKKIRDSNLLFLTIQPSGSSPCITAAGDSDASTISSCRATMKKNWKRLERL